MNRFDSGTHRNVVEGMKVCQKAWLYDDKRESDSERRAKPPETRCQRTCLLSVCLLLLFLLSL
jgi:hypothetical protein